MRSEVFDDTRIFPAFGEYSARIEWNEPNVLNVLNVAMSVTPIDFGYQSFRRGQLGPLGCV